MFETTEGTIKPIVYVGVIQDQKLLLVEYKDAPNPLKTGWWIPAPGLDFGEDPTEKAAAVVSEMGFADKNLRLQKVESFVLPGGWHLIYHFTCIVNGEMNLGDRYKASRWVTIQELEIMKDIAHGKWEIDIGKSYLSSQG